eukprot:7299227-Pyramimonas_sp.AAC.1
MRFTRDRLLGLARARLQQLARRGLPVRAVIGQPEALTEVSQKVFKDLVPRGADKSCPLGALAEVLRASGRKVLPPSAHRGSRTTLKVLRSVGKTGRAPPPGALTE